MRALDAFKDIDLDAVDLAALDEYEREDFIALVADRFGSEGDTLTDFIHSVRPDEPPPPHLQAVIEVFERARTQGGVRACISMPPRAGKTITMRSAIAWWLKHSPADVLAYCSYNSDIAVEHSYKARALARAVGVPMADDRQAVEGWSTEYFGGLRSAGVNTALTGRGVTGFAIVDDPFKDPQEANSPIVREKVWDWFNDVVSTRLEGWASLIVCHTRWHEDDLIGRLEKEGGWEIINIPAVCDDEDSDPLGRKIGDSFWPERPQFSIENLKAIEARNPFGFASLYQGKPRARGSRLFNGIHYFDPKLTNFNGCTAIIGVDPAASEKTTADWSTAVLQVIRDARNPDKATSYIMNVLRRQCTIPEFARQLLAFQRSHWNAPIAVEAVGAFQAVPQILRESAPGLKLIEIKSRKELHGDKFQRAQGIAGAWNAGRVLVPNDSPPWLEDYLAEMQRFTGVKDKQDDQVDASSHGWNTVVAAPVPPRRGAVAVPNRWR